MQPHVRPLPQGAPMALGKALTRIEPCSMVKNSSLSTIGSNPFGNFCVHVMVNGLWFILGLIEVYLQTWCRYLTRKQPIVTLSSAVWMRRMLKYLLQEQHEQYSMTKIQPSCYQRIMCFIRKPSTLIQGIIS